MRFTSAFAHAVRVLRRAGWTFVPGVMANRAVRWNMRYERTHGWRRIDAVQRGPFAGMKYPPETVAWTVLASLKEAGEYETEFAAVVAGELRRQPPLFVNVGAADGYYAVGGARMGVPTIAYESSPLERTALTKLAEANGVSVEVRGHCRRLPDAPEGTLFLLDVEGSESKLLGGDAPRRLASSTVLVELHEQFAPGITADLSRRFASTHTFESLTRPAQSGRIGGDPVWAILRPRG